MPLIGAADTAPLMGILFALAALGFWVDGHRQLQKTSGALWIIVCGVLLSNFHITPFESASYGFVFDYLLPVAIPLLLFKANLVLIFRESGKVMLTFLFASMATVIAAITALQFVDLGANSPEIAGVIAGGYIGGTMNFVAIGKAVGMDTDLFSVTIGANSVVSVIALSILIALPSISLVRRLIPSRIISEKNEAEAIAFNTRPPPRLKICTRPSRRTCARPVLGRLSMMRIRSSTTHTLWTWNAPPATPATAPAPTDCCWRKRAY